MPSRTPEEELNDYLATLPVFLRKYLLGEAWDETDTREYASSDPSWMSPSIKERFHELLKKMPVKRKEVERKTLQRSRQLWAIAPADLGRPRKDQKASDARRLKDAGKSYAQIARILGGTPDSIRKLIKSRQHLPPGEKSH